MKKYLILAAITLFLALTGCKKTPEAIPVTSVTIAPSSLNLIVGETGQLTAAVAPDDATNPDVTWGSSDNKVATVSDKGLVSAVAAGSATITATADGKRAVCTVTVEEPAPLVIPVSEVAIDITAVTLVEGESCQLTATVTPGDATDASVVWSSSNNSVASVSEDGKVSAIAPGEATITAKAGGKSATCLVTVQKAVVAVSGVTLDKTTLALTEGQLGQLAATVKPDDATDKTVTWSSSKTSVATVSDKGLVTAVSAGEATITAKAGGKSATCLVTVTAKTIPVESLSWKQYADVMEPGQTNTFVVTINPSNATDQNVTWTSSNTSVAIIANSSGTAANIKAIAGGTTNIKATCGGKSVSMNVKVMSGVYSVLIKNNKDTWMEGNQLYLTEGEDYQLTGEINAVDAVDKTILWESSNTSFVKVSSTGKVSAIKPSITPGGTVAAVRVTAKSKTDPTVNYVVYVYVYSKPTSIVVVSPQNPEFKYDESKNLVFKVYPETARQKVTVSHTGYNNYKWKVETVNDVTYKFQTPFNIQGLDLFETKFTFKVSTVGSTSVQISKTLEYYVDMWSADDVKPMDYVYYNASTDKFRTSDAGLRYLGATGNCRMASTLPAPSPTSKEQCVALVTYVGTFGPTSDNVSASVGLTNKSGVHGYAVALHDATLSGDSTFKWSDDKDDVDASENWHGDATCVTHISTGKEEWKKAFKLTYYAAEYNKLRGNSHDIKPLKALMEYGNNYPVGKFTTGSVTDLDGWNTRWVLPTFGMPILGSDNAVYGNTEIVDFNQTYALQTAFNGRVARAGGEAVAGRELWTVNTYDKNNAILILPPSPGTKSFGWAAKTAKYPLRCWLMF